MNLAAEKVFVVNASNIIGKAGNCQPAFSRMMWKKLMIAA